MWGVTRRLETDDRFIGRFLIASVAIGFALLLGAGLAAVTSTGRAQQYADWINHTFQVQIAIARVEQMVEQGETTRRGYLLTGRRLYRDANREVQARLPAALDRIATLTRDNPRQQVAVRDYRARIDAIVRERDRSIALVDAGRRADAARLFDAETEVRRMRDIRARADAMQVEESRLLAIRDAEQEQSVRRFYAIIGLAAGLLAVLALITTVTLFRFTRDLAASRDRLTRFNEALEDQVRLRTADLTRANEEIQRFAYIVSHDLRSPLVNVMGFTAELAAATDALRDLVDRAEAEAPALLTADATAAAREDLPEAIGFIRTSTEKMDRLINAILKLSREGRRVIAPEPFDPADIADGAVAALKQIADARGATIEVHRPMPPLVSDRLAVEQILSNLIENALKYLDPARAGHIVVAGREERGRVVLSVNDNGRGIAPADHQRVFDLFRRSGLQDQPGEGIGLAHVRALAYRLGGTVALESQLGEGSTFSLVLPATIQPEVRP